MTDQPPPADLAETAAHLEADAMKSYTRAGQWFARTLVLDTIDARRTSYANAERWAARGVELERQARKMRGSFEHVSDHG